MFRSGGPIKEGIMDGMQTKAALVGDPVFPKAADGRAKHYVNFAIPAFQALRIGAQRAIPKIANIFRTQVGTKGPGTVRIPGAPGTPGRFTTAGSKIAEKSGPGMPIYEPNFLGRDPTVRLIGGTIKAITNPTTTGALAKGARLVFSPTGLVTGAVYAGGKFFDSEGNEISKDKADELGLTAGDKIDEKVVTGESDKGGRTLTRDEEIEANRKRYYKLMGIDKLNKQASYNTLIDASNQIREGGNIKDQIKSGSLVSGVINALSKNLDSSVDLKKQIDAAILKGEITKDINKEKNQSEAELRELQKKVYQKKLAGSDLDDIAAEYRKTDRPLKGQTLFTEANRAGTDVDGILSTKEVDEFLNDNPTLTEADYIEKVQKDRIARKEAPLPEGNYVVGGRIVHISDGGLVDRFVF